VILHSMPDIETDVRPSELLCAVEAARSRLLPLLTTASERAKAGASNPKAALRIEDPATGTWIRTNPDGEGTYGGMAIDFDMDAGSYGDRPGRHPHIRVRMDGMAGRSDCRDEAQALAEALEATASSLAATCDDGEEDASTRALLDEQNLAVSIAVEDACSTAAWEEESPSVDITPPSPCSEHKVTIDFADDDGINILTPTHAAAWSRIGAVSVCIAVKMAKGDRPAHYMVVLSAGSMSTCADDLDPVERMRIMNTIPHVDEPLRIPQAMRHAARMAA
jgi:hypothetical protein